MTLRRAKITGIGFVTPAGIGIEQFESGILQPVSRIAALPPMGKTGERFVGAAVGGFRLAELMPEMAGRRLPRHTQFALLAAKLALRDAGLDFAEVKRHAPVVIAGASLMDSEVINNTILSTERKGVRFALPRVIFQAPVSAIGAEIGRLINGTVRTQALQSACCSGSDAIGHAAQLVQSGEADIAICGGTEAPLVYHPMVELCMAGLSPTSVEDAAELCRPFDRWRTTGVIGEGACFVVIEPESSPRPGYAFVTGYSYATDSDGFVAKGLAKAITLAIRNAGLSPDALDHLSCWGPGHAVIDRAESEAVHEVFGRNVERMAAYSIKGAIGNPLGAAGAIQVGCAALGLRKGFVPPTVNWRFPDPDCALNLSAEPRFVRTERALVNAHGLSGTNSVLVLERCS